MVKTLCAIHQNLLQLSLKPFYFFFLEFCVSIINMIQTATSATTKKKLKIIAQFRQKRNFKASQAINLLEFFIQNAYVPVVFIIILMTKKASRTGKVTVFIRKLLQMLKEADLQEYISWLPDENSFQIRNPTKFTQIVLPKYFKHNNMASFVRQLNMYGFTRLKDSEQHIYAHPKFKKGQINSIKFIKRKNVIEKRDKYSEDSCDSSQQDSSQQNMNQQAQRCIKICQKLTQENQALKQANHELRVKLRQFESFKTNIQKYLTENAHFLAVRKVEKQQGSTSGQDRSYQSKNEQKSKNSYQSHKSSFAFCSRRICNQEKQRYNALLDQSKQSQQNNII